MRSASGTLPRAEKREKEEEWSRRLRSRQAAAQVGQSNESESQIFFTRADFNGLISMDFLLSTVLLDTFLHCFLAAVLDSRDRLIYNIYRWKILVIN